MIVFRHLNRTTTVERLWRDYRRSHAAAGRVRIEGLLSAARLESAVADHWFAEEDDRTQGSETLLAASGEAARRYLGEPAEPAADWDRADWDRIDALLPAPRTQVQLLEPEGLRFYALSPAGFAAAAQSWQGQAAKGQPAWVLGLRSMGSVLAPVAWAALDRGPGLAHRCSTLRPRGDAFARTIRVSSQFRRELAAWPGAFLIADEGPGLSGSSFGGTIAFLLSLGCEPDRISLLSSWSPSPAEAARLRSPYAAANWTSWCVFPAPAMPLPASRVRAAVEISGGEWRRWLGGARLQPVWPQHERRKFLADFDAGEAQTVVKFAGFADFGRRTRQLAEALADGGWSPAVQETETCDGENAEAWIRLRRLRARALPPRPGPDWAAWAGRYFAWRREELTVGTVEPPSAELIQMLQTNLRRIAGVELALDPPAAAPVYVDGRLGRCEWAQTANGWVKFDSTDHGDDPFFPGPADIAWDLAGMEAEFPRAAATVLAAYRRQSGETEVQLEPRLRWHRLADGAFRTAFCVLAAQQTMAHERLRFQAEARRYLRFCLRALQAVAKR